MGDCEVVHQPMGKGTVTVCAEMKIKGNSCLVGSSQNTFLTKSQAYLVQTLQFARGQWFLSYDPEQISNRELNSGPLHPRPET